MQDRIIPFSLLYANAVLSLSFGRQFFAEILFANMCRGIAEKQFWESTQVITKNPGMGSYISAVIRLNKVAFLEDETFG